MKLQEPIEETIHRLYVTGADLESWLNRASFAELHAFVGVWGKNTSISRYAYRILIKKILLGAGITWVLFWVFRPFYLIFMAVLPFLRNSAGQRTLKVFLLVSGAIAALLAIWLLMPEL